MAEWSKLTPPCPIREVETARKRALALRQQVPKRNEQRDQAATHVIELERADRARMAAQMAAGEDAVSDVEAIEQARAQAAGARRTAEASALAIQTAEDEVHAAVLKNRGRWVERVQRDVVKTRAEAEAALAALTAALHHYRDAQQTEGWLSEGAGLDRERPPKMGALGFATGSERITGNRQAVDLPTVLGWIEQALQPRVPPKPEPQSLQQPIAR